jgi:hypothetical protein
VLLLLLLLRLLLLLLQLQVVVVVLPRFQFHLNADHRHLSSEECSSLRACTSSPMCWADMLLFVHAKQIPIFLPIPGSFPPSPPVFFYHYIML